MFIVCEDISSVEYNTTLHKNPNSRGIVPFYGALL